MVAIGRPPGTWQEFVSVSAHLARASAAEGLRLADAVAAHKQDSKGWRQWIQDHSDLAGI